MPKLVPYEGCKCSTVKGRCFPSLVFWYTLFLRYYDLVTCVRYVIDCWCRSSLRYPLFESRGILLDYSILSSWGTSATVWCRDIPLYRFCIPWGCTPFPIDFTVKWGKGWPNQMDDILRVEKSFGRLNSIDD